jgi:hypothetical protein
VEKKAPRTVKVNKRRTEIDIYVEPGVVRKQLAITYWNETLSPSTIFMWEDEWSPEKEDKAIAEDILKREKAQGGTSTITI